VSLILSRGNVECVDIARIRENVELKCPFFKIIDGLIEISLQYPFIYHMLTLMTV